MLKKLLYVLIALFLVYLVLCFTGTKDFKTSVSKTISGTPEQVFAQVSEFKNWPNWAKWIKEDTTMKLTFGNPSSGVGGSYSWVAKDYSGKMTFTEVIPNKMTKSTLHFENMGDDNDVVMELKPNGIDKTDVTWSMMGQKPTPFMARGFQTIMGLIFDMKKDFEKGLSNLDEYIKSGKAGLNINGYSIHESQFKAKDYLTIRKTLKFNEIGNFFSAHFPAIGQIAGQNINGTPSGLYWKWDEKNQTTDMAAAFPVAQNIDHPTYKMIHIADSKELTIDYYGAYDKTMLAYAALDSAINLKKLKHNMVVEEYITDPMTEKDTTKWLTKIHFLVQ